MEVNWKEHIESNPKVMFGKPVIKGTRIPVDIILEKLSLGETIDQLLKSYPSIKIDSIFACLKFASESVKNEVVTA
ncbi:MAG: DUF433 domain-containing protein [Ignavibacteria bacterium]|nr:DUF433 domain-containing protein [Ignavibacteria bacterium]